MSEADRDAFMHNRLEPFGPIDLALRRAQASNAALVRHIYSLIETTRQRGAPDAETLIMACEHTLREAHRAAERIRQ